MRFFRWFPPAAVNAKIAERWKAQYCRGNVWRHCDGPDSSERIYEKLQLLGERPTDAEIVSVIGNDSWINVEEEE
jgi:hypothetical protein